jgi:hypothetical protein
MYKVLLSGLLCVLAISGIQAQGDDSEEQIETRSDDKDLPRLTLKTRPLGLISFVPSVVLAADVRLYRSFGLELEGGRILSSFLVGYEGESYKGTRLRLTAKWHFADRKRSIMYMGLTYKFQDAHHLRYRNLERQGGQYTELTLLGRNVLIRGYLIRYGFQYYLGKKRRVFIEPSVGVGISRRIIRHDPIPPDSEYRGLPRNQFSLELREGQHTLPDLALGVHIGWAF